MKKLKFGTAFIVCDEENTLRAQKKNDKSGVCLCAFLKQNSVYREYETNNYIEFQKYV